MFKNLISKTFKGNGMTCLRNNSRDLPNKKDDTACVSRSSVYVQIAKPGLTESWTVA